MKICGITPVSIRCASLDGIPRIIAGTGVTNPDSPNISLLVEFKATPNGRDKFIIITDYEVIHVEPDHPEVHATLYPYQQFMLQSMNIAQNKIAQRLHANIKNTIKTALGKDIGVYRMRKRPHRTIPSKEEIAEFLDD